MKADKRERLVNAAATLIHQQGYHRTTLADIAEESGVPLGNVYYYFKTKDDIASAVVDRRTEEFLQRTQHWQSLPTPGQRLHAFLDMAEGHREAASRHGCPIGSLCQELDKDPSPLAEKADRMLQAHTDWAKQQFQAMHRDDADELGIRFISTIQGTVLVAHALKDADLIRREIVRLREWVDTL